MMQTQPIHWHEGMFLRPQHFQLSTRHSQSQADRGDRWNCHYNWGLRSFALDQQALANYRFSVRSLEARFRDGTQVAMPDDLMLDALDVKPALLRNGQTTVYLALPLVQASRSKISTRYPSITARGSRAAAARRRSYSGSSMTTVSSSHGRQVGSSSSG